MGVEVLLTNLSSSLLQSAETRKLIDLLTQRKLAFELVDGSAAESRDKRNEMWEKSGKRSYPQVFLNGEFFGDLDTIQVRAPTSRRSTPPAHRARGARGSLTGASPLSVSVRRARHRTFRPPRRAWWTATSLTQRSKTT